MAFVVAMGFCGWVFHHISYINGCSYYLNGLNEKKEKEKKKDGM